MWLMLLSSNFYLTPHYNAYVVVSYEQDWTMSCKKVIELT